MSDPILKSCSIISHLIWKSSKRESPGSKTHTKIIPPPINPTPQNNSSSRISPWKFPAWPPQSERPLNCWRKRNKKTENISKKFVSPWTIPKITVVGIWRKLSVPWRRRFWRWSRRGKWWAGSWGRWWWIRAETVEKWVTRRVGSILWNLTRMMVGII